MIKQITICLMIVMMLSVVSAYTSAPTLKEIKYSDIYCNGKECKVTATIVEQFQVGNKTRYNTFQEIMKTNQSKIVTTKGKGTISTNFMGEAIEKPIITKVLVEKTNKDLETEFAVKREDLQKKYIDKYKIVTTKAPTPTWTLKTTFASIFDAVKGVFK